MSQCVPRAPLAKTAVVPALATHKTPSPVTTSAARATVQPAGKATRVTSMLTNAQRLLALRVQPTLSASTRSGVTCVRVKKDSIRTLQGCVKVS